MENLISLAAWLQAWGAIIWVVIGGFLVFLGFMARSKTARVSGIWYTRKSYKVKKTDDKGVESEVEVPLEAQSSWGYFVAAAIMIAIGTIILVFGTEPLMAKQLGEREKQVKQIEKEKKALEGEKTSLETEKADAAAAKEKALLERRNFEELANKANDRL